MIDEAPEGWNIFFPQEHENALNQIIGEACVEQWTGGFQALQEVTLEKVTVQDQVALSPPPSCHPNIRSEMVVNSELQILRGYRAMARIGRNGRDGNVIIEAGQQQLLARNNLALKLGLNYRHWSKRIAWLTGLGNALLSVLEYQNGSMLMRAVGQHQCGTLQGILAWQRIA